MLGYPGGSNAVTRLLVKQETGGSKTQCRRCDSGNKRLE